MTPVELTKQISTNNYFSFLWHATFLALAQNFMDVDTILPAMLIEAGGGAMHVGLLTAIMIGGTSFAQLVFSPFLNNRRLKKKYLLIGINTRVLALAGLSVLLGFSLLLRGNMVIGLIFFLVTLFSLSGAFANISYTDILGKSLLLDSRKSFLSIKQVITGSGVLLSAFFARKVLTGSLYPENYMYMFLIATVSLGFASLGFWNLKEVDAIRHSVKIKSLKEYIGAIKREITENKKLTYFLAFVNTLGISIAILPFIILYAKEKYMTGSSETGNFLLFKVLGVVSVGMALFIYSKKIKYRYMLYLTAILALLIPVYLISMRDMPHLLPVFLIGGMVFSLYMVSMNGVLLEISNNENRALYTGIAGAGNIIPTLFPLIGGWIISQLGFYIFFGVFMLIVSFSLYFIYKLNCLK